jgi:hypothetical protein
MVAISYTHRKENEIWDSVVEVERQRQPQTLRLLGFGKRISKSRLTKIFALRNGLRKNRLRFRGVFVVVVPCLRGGRLASQMMMINLRIT